MAALNSTLNLKFLTGVQISLGEFDGNNKSPTQVPSLFLPLHKLFYSRRLTGDHTAVMSDDGYGDNGDAGG